MTKAATYVRLSAPSRGDDDPGLDQQREALALAVRERGWDHDPSLAFHDADISSRSGASRPGLTELKALITSRGVDAVVVWKLDRSFRSLMDAVTFLTLCREFGVAFISISEGVDTSAPFGEVLFELFNSMAALESRSKSDRVTAWHGERAERGLPGGGGHRPFGYEDDKVTIRSDEAALIRDAADRAVQGASLRSIVKGWHDQGTITTAGKPWTTNSLRRLLISPRIAGMRERNGVVVAEGAWDAIIDRETHERLRARLLAPSSPSSGARSYLLTGIATCSLCGAKLVARPKNGRSMVCATGPNFDGCGGIRVQADPLEELVAAALVERHSSRDVAEVFGDAADADSATVVAQLHEDRKARDQLVDDRYVHRIIPTEAAYLSASNALTERIEAAERRLASRDTHVVLTPGLASRWAAADLTQRRELIDVFLESVVVSPAVRGRNTFDPARVKLTWRNLDEHAV